MLFNSKTGMRVYIPNDRLCACVHADGKYASVWCAGENEIFEVEPEEAKRIMDWLESRERTGK